MFVAVDIQHTKRMPTLSSVACPTLFFHLFFVLWGGGFTLDAGLLAGSQYSEGRTTGLLDTGFSWFPFV